MNRLAAEAVEREASLPVPVLDLVLLDLILALHTEPADLVLQELVDALPDGLPRRGRRGFGGPAGALSRLPSTHLCQRKVGDGDLALNYRR